MDVSLLHRFYLLVLSMGYFSVSYFSTQIFANKQLSVSIYFLPIDHYQTFIEWMIIPYSSSSVLYCYLFLATKKRENLQLLLVQLSWAVFIASILFIFFPAKFSLPIDSINNEILRWIFAQLHAIDSPFNQAPSLHVIFCVIFFVALKRAVKSRKALMLTRVWIVLVALSTWFTFQHHSFDILAGLIIGLAINKGVNKPQHYCASIILMISGISLLIASYFSYFSLISSVFFYYVCLSLMLTSVMYLFNKPSWIAKNINHFRYPSLLMFGPYIAAYKIVWRLNNLLLSFKRKDNEQLITKVTSQLWLGPRLQKTQLDSLPENCVIIDVSAELSEADIRDPLRQNKFIEYLAFPLLDLQPPQRDQLLDPVNALVKHLSYPERTVYLHCAMGYSRCFLIACLYLMSAQGYSVERAKARLLSLNRHVKLPQHYIDDQQLIEIANYIHLSTKECNNE